MYLFATFSPMLCDFLNVLCLHSLIFTSILFSLHLILSSLPFLAWTVIMKNYAPSHGHFKNNFTEGRAVKQSILLCLLWVSECKVVSKIYLQVFFTYSIVCFSCCHFWSFWNFCTNDPCLVSIELAVVSAFLRNIYNWIGRSNGQVSVYISWVTDFSNMFVEKSNLCV